jgi:two-component system, OmpR family, response regulator
MMPDLRLSADQAASHNARPTARTAEGMRTMTSGGNGSGFAEAGATALTGSRLHSTAATKRMKILVIEDDAAMRVLLRGCFEHAGFAVVEAANADELWVAMAQHQFDLVTLDVRLPGAGGLELVQAIRQRSNVPVVMISVITNLIDRVAALERGADDFIVKPFDLMDLLARVRAVVRRSEIRSGVLPTLATRRRYAFDGWLFDAGRRELTSLRGDVKSLTDQELSLLELFVLHPQRELSRETIINHLHGTSNGDVPIDAPDTPEPASADGDAHSSRLRVDMQVSRLRKKLELPDSPVSVIKSVRGVGYVFATTVDAKIG